MSAKAIEKVLSAPNLPSLPAVALEVLELTRDPDVALPKLAKAVGQDPAMASRILKTVNSSFYGLSKPCPTITRALAYLGMNTVKSLVLGFSLAESFVGDDEADAFGFSFMSLWRGSLYSAASTRLIAEDARSAVEPDEAFMAALLQDIGMLACASVLGDEYTMGVGEVVVGDEEILEREAEVLRFNHVQVGTALATRWKLPDEIVKAIEYHHRAGEAPETVEELAKLVTSGRQVAGLLLSAPERRASARKIVTQTCQEWYGLDGNATAGLIGLIDASCRELARLFNVPTADLPDAQSLMSEANDRMIEHQITMDQENDRLAREQDRLIHEALTDGLTNVPNRKKFDMFLEESFASAQRNDTPVSVILLDADKFKTLNDTLGHQAGDAVLVELAKRASSCMPDNGLFARYGGEEFAAVLPDADASEGGRVAESIRKAVCGSPFSLEGVPCDETEVEVSVSCGVSAREIGCRDILKSAATLLRGADKAVYAAKEAGRNRVRVVRLKPDAEPVTKQAAGADGSGAAGEHAGGPQPRILIVEDDAMQRKLIATPLEKSGEYEVVAVGNAAGALEALGVEPAREVEPFTFMLVDLGLPDINGVELVARIRKRGELAETPVVVLSASEDEQQVAAVMNAGANAFISKSEIADDPKNRVLDIAAFWSRTLPPTLAA